MRLFFSCIVESMGSTLFRATYQLHHLQNDNWPPEILIKFFCSQFGGATCYSSLYISHARCTHLGRHRGRFRRSGFGIV